MDTNSRVSVDATTNPLEKDLTGKGKYDKYLSPYVNLKCDIRHTDHTVNKEEIDISRPSEIICCAQPDMDRSLKSIDSGHDNMTLCDDLHDVALHSGLENDPKNETESLEKGGICEQEEVLSQLSEDSTLTKKTRPNSLMEDIIKDLHDREIIGEDSLFDISVDSVDA